MTRPEVGFGLFLKTELNVAFFFSSPSTLPRNHFWLSLRFVYNPEKIGRSNNEVL